MNHCLSLYSNFAYCSFHLILFRLISYPPLVSTHSGIEANRPPYAFARYIFRLPEKYIIIYILTQFFKILASRTPGYANIEGPVRHIYMADALSIPLWVSTK